MLRALCTVRHVRTCLFINRAQRAYKFIIMTNRLSSIESAIEDIKKGKLVIVVDDEDRENEGDFIAAADTVTPEIINFMSKHGRGLICAPLTEERCEALQLDL